MTLAISNIAWDASEEEAVADLLQAMMIAGVEVAPTKRWPQPLAATDTEVHEYRELWQRRGVRIVAIQALLFGRPDLTIFDDAAARQRTFDYLSGMIRLAGRLGAGVLVFGSPKNRLVGAREPAEVAEIAIPFFRGLAAVAIEHQAVLCLEPNPPAYGCDYLTTSDQALELIRAVNHEGLGLHLDAGGMTLAGEPSTAIEAALPWLRHFHISEPHLEMIGDGGADHRGFGATLVRAGYRGWTSIEMRPAATNNVSRIAEALKRARECYVPLPLAPAGR